MLTVEKVDRLTRGHAEMLSISAEASIVQASEKMRQCQVGCLLVLGQDGRLDGLLTERDIIAKVICTGENPFTVRVKQIMVHDIITCSPATLADDAQRLMVTHAIRHLPIVENGLPVGMVSSRDIMAQQLATMRAELQQQNRLLNQLEREHPGISKLDTDNSGRVVI